MKTTAKITLKKLIKMKLPLKMRVKRTMTMLKMNLKVKITKGEFQLISSGYSNTF